MTVPWRYLCMQSWVPMGGLLCCTLAGFFNLIKALQSMLGYRSMSRESGGRDKNSCLEQAWFCARDWLLQLLTRHWGYKVMHARTLTCIYAPQAHSAMHMFCVRWLLFRIRSLLGCTFTLKMCSGELLSSPYRQSQLPSCFKYCLWAILVKCFHA